MRLSVVSYSFIPLWQVVYAIGWLKGHGGMITLRFFGYGEICIYYFYFHHTYAL